MFIYMSFTLSFTAHYDRLMETITTTRNEMTNRAHKQMAISFAADDMLTELSAKRKNEGAIIRAKKDITAEAIAEFYKREIKK